MERQVPAVGVVPPLDELEDGQAGLNLGGEPPPVEQLALERREETLAEGVVVRVPDLITWARH